MQYMVTIENLTGQNRERPLDFETIPVLNGTGTTIAALKAVNLFNNSGVTQVRLANLSSGNDKPAYGFVREALTTTSSGNVILAGVIGDFVDGGGVGTLTPAAWYWLDPTSPGDLTDTRPTATGAKHQRVGIALNTKELYVIPQLPDEDYPSGGGGGGGSGISSGASFPLVSQPNGTPYINYTSHRIGIYDNANNEWLSSEQFVETYEGSLSADGKIGGAGLGWRVRDYAMRLEGFKYRAKIDTTVSGSHYWKFALKDDSATSYISDQNLSSYSAGVIGDGSGTTFLANPIPASANHTWLDCWIAAGSPGPLTVAFELMYRQVLAIANFLPTDISNLLLWVDPTALTGLSNNDPVATWTDQSGNGNDLTQSSSGLKPLYKTAIQNGLPVLRFDGSDDYMQISALAGGASAQANTIYLVTKHTAGGSFPMLFNSADTSKVHAAYVIESSGMLALFAGNNPTTGYTVPHTWNVWCFIFNGASSALYVDNVSVATYDVGTQDLNGFTVASTYPPTSGQYNNADYGDVLVYHGAHNSTERTNVYNYLKDKWGL